MEHRGYGRTGLTVSALGFGCGAIGGLMTKGDPDEQVRAVKLALDSGINYFDTATSYGNGKSEEALGRALTALDAHDRVVVGTKVRLKAGLAPDEIGPAVRQSIEGSLERLQRSSVHILHLHNSISAGRDGDGRDGYSYDLIVGPILAAMREVQAAGLTQHLGFTAQGEPSRVMDVAYSGGFQSMQTYFNLLNPSSAYSGATGGARDFSGLTQAAGELGMGAMAIRILAAGAVSGPDRAENASDASATAMGGSNGFEADVARAQALQAEVAAAGAESTVELAIRFALSAKEAIPMALVGLSNVGQLEAALRYAEKGPLSEDQVKRLVAAARP
jgi:aryl-alcohol dehydrogenase-like predicted oxidoreductase